MGSQAEKNPWVPFDLESWKEEKNLEESPEENAVEFRDIYQFMYEKPHYVADHFYQRKDYHQHNGYNQEFAEELTPLMLPLMSSASKVFCSNVTSILLLLCLVFTTQ